MNKNHSTIFSCSHCGAQFQKWVGRCLECGQWGTVEKNLASPLAASSSAATVPPVSTVKLADIKMENFSRPSTNLAELDRVLGGGLVTGSLILLGGEPGVGKSTLALQLAALLPQTIYFSGEESIEQIKMRAQRLELPASDLRLANTTDLETIISTALNEHARCVVIDSVQTLHSQLAAGEAGSITQVRASAATLLEIAKKNNLTFILIGQVTKDGSVAGPKTLEHLVDTVLYLEGDRFHDFRILRAAKNRFGPTAEVGVFSMSAKGLKEVLNPSAAFLTQRSEPTPGTVITCLMEGTRPLLVEIQALVAKTNFGYPQRRASGFDLNRLQVLVGVLSKRAGLPLDNYDIFLNVAGGLSADEPAADLAVILALASGLKNKTLPTDLAAFGEVGLGGEVRPVNHTDKRLQEIKNLGMKYAVTPAGNNTDKITGLKIAPLKNVREVVEKIIK